MGSLCCDHFYPIYTHMIYEFFTKTLTIISISTTIRKLYVGDPLGSYILLINNSIDPMKISQL